MAKLSLSEFSLAWINSIKEVSEIIIGVENREQFLQHILLLNEKNERYIFKEAIKINFRDENILIGSLQNGKKVIAIIQARMSSSRSMEKVLKTSTE